MLCLWKGNHTVRDFQLWGSSFGKTGRLGTVEPLGKNGVPHSISSMCRIMAVWLSDIVGHISSQIPATLCSQSVEPPGTYSWNASCKNIQCYSGCFAGIPAGDITPYNREWHNSPYDPNSQGVCHCWCLGSLEKNPAMHGFYTSRVAGPGECRIPEKSNCIFTPFSNRPYKSLQKIPINSTQQPQKITAAIGLYWINGMATSPQESSATTVLKSSKLAFMTFAWIFLDRNAEFI